ncbi:hypothetical protein HY409_02925 [Candidatus Gottesmanbacteria bacterium]|nr:hypothetical protein [Candidatus Gottesmanbacteria bacterium]
MLDQLHTPPLKDTVSLLLREETPDSLTQLELLLAHGDVAHEMVIGQLIYDWAHHEDDTSSRPLPPTDRPPPYIQYEGLRDGDQIGAPGIGRLSRNLNVAKEIFTALPHYGVRVADLGMPISGPQEREKILAMMKFINEQQLPIFPAVASRTHPDDVTAIAELAGYAQKNFDIRPLVYAFLGSSRIRMLAQGTNKWSLANLTRMVTTTVDALKSNSSIGPVIVPFEDTYGSHPDDISILINAAFESGADGICICDTASRGQDPAWTSNLIRYIGHTIAPLYPKKIWEIHTHNMMGKATENALLAYEEGLITGVHGTLGGVGDLGGNMPIDEFILEAHRRQLSLAKPEVMSSLDALVDTALNARGISRDLNPFGNIYSPASRLVPSGIHAAAFRRMDEVGPHMKRILEHVYFPVAPSDLGLSIELGIVTPASGATNVHALARRLGYRDKLTDEHIAAVLTRARQKGEPITDDEFQQVISEIDKTIFVYRE